MIQFILKDNHHVVIVKCFGTLLIDCKHVSVDKSFRIAPVELKRYLKLSLVFVSTSSSPTFSVEEKA